MISDDDFDDEATTLPGFTRPPRTARVLLAEDDDAMRELVTTLLEADGREVVAVSNGDEMMEVLTEGEDGAWPNEAFDVIVTDQRMPYSNGLDVIAALRLAGSETPALLISGYDDDALRDLADELETMVIHKPFPLPTFRAAVNVLLSLRPSRV